MCLSSQIVQECTRPYVITIPAVVLYLGRNSKQARKIGPHYPKKEIGQRSFQEVPRAFRAAQSTTWEMAGRKQVRQKLSHRRTHIRSPMQMTKPFSQTEKKNFQQCDKKRIRSR